MNEVIHPRDHDTALKRACLRQLQGLASDHSLSLDDLVLLELKTICEERRLREPLKKAKAKGAALALAVPESAEARRYKLVVELCKQIGHAIPKNDYDPLPRGINKLAEAEGISVGGFSKSVKKYLSRRHS